MGGSMRIKDLPEGTSAHFTDDKQIAYEHAGQFFQIKVSKLKQIIIEQVGELMKPVLTRKYRTLLVADSSGQKRYLSEKFPMEDYHICVVGDALAGRGFKDFVDLTSTPQTEHEARKRQDWFYRCVHTKIVPGAK